MSIVIAGAGEVGRHAAEVLVGDGHNVVMVDLSAAKLRALEDRLDVRTLQGNCAHAEVLREAGVAKCELLLAATDIDEINLLAAIVAKGIGAKRTLVRVHHSAYFSGKGLDYATHLGIEELICPEYLTSQAIARTLRNPGALAIEEFARGQIEMQELPVDEDGAAIGKPLAELKLPAGVRLAQIRRNEATVLPSAKTTIQVGDVVTLIGERKTFEQGRKIFAAGTSKRKTVVIMGGTAMSVWLSRALEKREFSVRLFEKDAERAEELSNKLPHVTVIRADPTEQEVQEEERIGHADAFVAVTADDEHNILSAAQAKSLGAKMAISVVQRTTYMHLYSSVGVDRAFSPRVVAAAAVRKMLDVGPVRLLASLSDGAADVYEIRPTRKSIAVGKELRNLKLPPECMIGAIQRDGTVKVPGADDTIAIGDTLLLIGPDGIERKLKKIFATK